MADTAQQFQAMWVYFHRFSYSINMLHILDLSQSDQKILEEPMLSVPKGIPPTGIDKFIYPIKLNLIGAQKLHIQVII